MILYTPKAKASSRGCAHRIPHPYAKAAFFAAFALTVAAMQLLSLPCPFISLFGIPCPGCGMTRAFIALSRLDIPGAFSANPVFPAVPILFLFILFDGKLFGGLTDRLIVSAA